MSSEASSPLRWSEALALAAARDLRGRRILCTTLGQGQAAAALAAARPDDRVTCRLLDEYQRRQAAADAPPNCEMVVSADAPTGPFDLAVVPIAKRGEAELARDWIQSACQSLDTGGMLVATIDNGRDAWLRTVIAGWFDRVGATSDRRGTTYTARKQRDPRKWKDFRCQFALRDRGRLLQAVSRPGVFAHRRTDVGARQLINGAEPAAGARILDLGCGSGVVGLALAARDPTCRVHAIDSHARAIECTLAGAQLNGLANVTAELSSNGPTGPPGQFDLVLTNPPYYSQFAIAQRFLEVAHAALRPGGQLLVVTKSPEWYLEALAPLWHDVTAEPSKGFALVRARRSAE